MHYYQSMIATDIARERIRDAAQQRLAEEARHTRGQPGFATRLRTRISLLLGQLRSRPRLAVDSPDCI